MIYSKKGISMYLVTLIITLVSFLLLFVGLKPFMGLMSSAGEQRMCQMSAIQSSISKRAAIVNTGTPTMPLRCPYEKKKITFTNIASTSAIAAAKSKIKAHNIKIKDLLRKNPKLGSEEKYKYPAYFGAGGDNDEDKYGAVLYNVNEIIGKEMRQCWEKLGKGKLDLFSNWFELLHWDPDLFGLEPINGGFWDTVSGAVKNAYRNLLAAPLKLAGMTLAEITDKIGITDLDYIQWKRAPNFCVICSKITFDKNAREEIHKALKKNKKLADNPGHYYDTKTNNILTFFDWAQRTPIPFQKMMYLDYLQDDIRRGMSIQPADFAFKIPNGKKNQPLAVVFKQTNIHYSMLAASWVANIIPGLEISKLNRQWSGSKNKRTNWKGVHRLQLVDFNTKSFKKELKCDHLEGLID